MNVLTIFEQRIGAIFEEGAPDEQQPFSFRRLARRMVREMENETFVIDGVDTAPALYTVLVSQNDDFYMRKLYINICDEMSQLIEAQAKKRGYTFVGRPLVRFMVDPALRRGRFSVFAENIDPRTLARLRDEENAYLGITSPRDIYPADTFVPETLEADDEEPSFVSSEVSFAPEEPVQDESLQDGEPYEEESYAEEPFVEEPLAEEPFKDDSLPASEDNRFEPLVEDVPKDLPSEPYEDSYAEPYAETYADEEESLDADDGAGTLAEDLGPSCTLTDRDSGETFRIVGERVTIGRERAEGSVVLSDPNASRRHAELVWIQGGWVVRDLNSTNGTLVNDVERDTWRLSEGDVLTIGITNLEFRAG